MSLQKAVPVFTLFTKADCYLCDVLKAVLARNPTPNKLVQVDITLPDHALWYARYKHDIPVLHINGHFFVKHRLAAEELSAAFVELDQGVFKSRTGDPNTAIDAGPTPLN